ncbi:MAG: hypothetical protein FJW31_07425 [Acidobacteria bacterium]|nr:hypothetical protein [Acidobacteriota bacterium]
MKLDIDRLIAAISPETYCVPAKRREVRRVLDEGRKRGDPLAVRHAAALAVSRSANDIALEELQSRSALDPGVLRHPLERHTFACDSMDQSLEAFYFTLLDHLAGHGWQVTKLVDHLDAAAGSGFGGDLSRRAMKAQQEAARLLEASQELVEKLLHCVERIKDMERQLAALSVGGTGPIPHLKSPAQTISAPSLSTGTEEETSSRSTFTADEVRVRLELERGQLRAQMDRLRLQAHWLQPWLRTAEELHEHGSPRPDLVSAFNTALLDVVLLARRALPIEELIHESELPRFFAKAPHRNYTPAVLIELRFRAAPRRVATGAHAFRGRVEACLTSYALHDAEVVALQRELERDEVGHLLKAVGVGSPAATEAMLADIERLLAAGKPKAEVPKHSDPNPFMILGSLLLDLWRWLISGRRARQGPDDLTPDRPSERILRSQSVLLSRRDCLDLFGAVKHLTHQLALLPTGWPPG